MVPLAQHPQGTLRVSPALLHGAERITALFEGRTAAVKADYEEKIRALVQERDEHAKRRRESEEEARRLHEETQVLRSEIQELKKQLAVNAAAHLQPLAVQGGGGGSPQAEPESDMEYSLNPLDFIRSPTRSATLPTLDSSSTMSSLSSPLPDPTITQVGTHPAVPAHPPQISPAVRSPTPTFTSDVASTCPSLSPSVAMAGPSNTSPSTASKVSRRLIIRVPPSMEPPRRRIKPRIPPLPDGITEVVHVPRDEGSAEEDEEEDDSASWSS